MTESYAHSFSIIGINVLRSRRSTSKHRQSKHRLSPKPKAHQFRASKPEPRAPELYILSGAGAGAQFKNRKEPELILKFMTGAGATVWPFER